MMGNPAGLLDKLAKFDIENIPAKTLKKLSAYTSDERFNIVTSRKGSKCAASLCEWVLNIEEYH